MSKLNLWQINKFICRQRYKPGTSANVPGLYYHRKSLHKNTPRSPCGERGAKTKLVFTAARCLQSRSYAAGGARYLQADLMLPTHAGCAFKDPRGRFGISYPIAVRYTEQHTAPESEIRVDRFAGSWAGRSAFFCRTGHHSQVRAAALRSNRRRGAAAFHSGKGRGRC